MRVFFVAAQPRSYTKNVMTSLASTSGAGQPQPCPLPRKRPVEERFESAPYRRQMSTPYAFLSRRIDARPAEAP